MCTVLKHFRASNWKHWHEYNKPTSHFSFCLETDMKIKKYCCSSSARQVLCYCTLYNLFFQQDALPPYVRPWQTPVPPLTEKVVETMPYPSDDEANGMVYLAWRGPPAQVCVCIHVVTFLHMKLTPTRQSGRDHAIPIRWWGKWNGLFGLEGTTCPGVCLYMCSYYSPYEINPYQTKW